MVALCFMGRSGTLARSEQHVLHSPRMVFSDCYELRKLHPLRNTLAHILATVFLNNCHCLLLQVSQLDK